MKYHVDLIRNLTKGREPDFNNVLSVLNKKVPSRHTLFEFFMNDNLYQELAGYDTVPKDPIENLIMRIEAFRVAGYDYCTLHASDFSFPTKQSNHGKKSLSINEGAVITDRESFEAYSWQNPDEFDFSRLSKLKEHLPSGMKLLVMGPSGVLENVTNLLGYDNLCYLLADDPELVEDVFHEVGTRLVRYYELSVCYDSVGACFSNDDWGFNTQTMLSPNDMRKYVFKWHKKIVDIIHKAGKPALLHSCGQLNNVYPDIINDLKYDGKHSYEDNIMPVEEAYEQFVGKIAVLGGIDLDFIIRSHADDVNQRAKQILKQTQSRGGYGLGSGNSIPYYVPHEKYYAMIAAALMLTGFTAI